jgi:hypothetical protein
MNVNFGPGPDLINKDKCVELKTGISEENWTILEKQVPYGDEPETTCYLLLLRYELSRPPSAITSHDIRNLEALVVSRTGYFVGWDWVRNLTPHKGKHDTYRYPRLDLLPKIIATRKVNKGRINFTCDVLPREFGL